MTTGVRSVRLAVDSDAGACAAILNDWIEATPWMPRIHTEEDVVRYYRETVFPTQEILVVGSYGVDGFLALKGNTISALYVAERARRQGAGRALLNAAKARQIRLQLWTFEANDSARRFYRREGFHEIRRTAGDNEEGLPDILLGWDFAE